VHRELTDCPYSVELECFLVDLKNGSNTTIKDDDSLPFDYDAKYDIYCEQSGAEFVKFLYDDEKYFHDGWKNPYWYGGVVGGYRECPDDDRKSQLKYLSPECGAVCYDDKTVTVRAQQTGGAVCKSIKFKLKCGKPTPPPAPKPTPPPVPKPTPQPMTLSPTPCEKRMCPSDPKKKVMYRKKDDGKCEEKCVKDQDVPKKESEGFSFCPCGGEGNDTCDICGKPRYLEFLYTGTNCLDEPRGTCNDQGKSLVTGGGDNGVQSISWSVGNKDGCSGIDSGTVMLGDTFSFSTNDKFDSNIKICLKGSNLDQTINFHASCSSPIIKDDKFGFLQLVGYSSDPSPGTCGF